MQFLDEIQLAPEPINITGVTQAINITRFPFDYLKESILPIVEQHTVEVCALYFVNPQGYQHSEADLHKLRSKLGVDQIVTIFNEGMRINGRTPAATQDVKKN